MKRNPVSLMMFCATLFLASCGYRAIPMAKNDVEASVAEITNQYKRRADLIPNLLEVVKGYAKHEAQTLESVVAARAKATQVTLDPTKLSTEKLKEFQTSQGELSQALGRLMVIAEQYPDLKANQNFRDLQVQLEGSENRITVARNRYIDAIRRFNNLVTVAPQSWTNSLIFHFEKMPQWNVTEEEQKKNEQPPQVKF